MRSSGGDLQSSDPEEFEQFLKILNIQFDKSIGRCSYDFPTDTDINSRKKRIQETEAAGCPALFVPGMVEEIIDFYIKEMFLCAEEQ